MAAHCLIGVNVKLTAGSLLIAPPLMPDPRFQETVLVLCHHSNTGSFALAANVISQYDCKHLSAELGLSTDLPFPLYWGGPVNPGSVWMLHSADWYIDQTLTVNDNWSITSHDTMFHHIADGDTPREFRLCHGFASWGPGQLEWELQGTQGSSWVYTDDPGPDWLFNTPEDNLWETATERAQRSAINEWL